MLYVADQDEDDVFELFSAPLDGSTPAVKLNAPLVSGGDVILSEPPYSPNASWPQVTPDGRSVVYRADQDLDDVFELYGVPIDGSRAPVKLSQALGPDGDIFSALISPDGTWALYVAYSGPPAPLGLFRVPLRGGLHRLHRRIHSFRSRASLACGPGE